MASLKYTPNSSIQTVTLGSNYIAGSGSMDLTAGHGTRLPSSGDFWLGHDTGAGFRFFKITARSTDNLTVVPDATEGLGDGNIASGQTLRWCLTCAALDQLRIDCSALVLLKELTASGSASLDFTTRTDGGALIQSDFEIYEVVLLAVRPATNNATLRMRFSTNGGSSWISSSTYQWGLHRYNPGGSAQHGSNSDSSIGLNNGQSNSSSDAGLSGNLLLIDPAGVPTISGKATGYLGGSNPDGYVIEGYNTTTGIDSIQFYESTGNIATGKIKVYGRR